MLELGKPSLIVLDIAQEYTVVSSAISCTLPGHWGLGSIADFKLAVMEDNFQLLVMEILGRTSETVEP